MAVVKISKSFKFVSVKKIALAALSGVALSMGATSAKASAPECEGAQLSYSEMVSLFSPGTDVVALGKAEGSTFTRKCHPVTGCSAETPVESDSVVLWQDGTSPYYWQNSYSVSRDGEFGLHANATGEIQFVFVTNSLQNDKTNLQLFCSLKPGQTSFSGCYAKGVHGTSFVPFANQFDISPSFTHTSCSIYGCYNSESAVRVNPASVRVTRSCASFSMGNEILSWHVYGAY